METIVETQTLTERAVGELTEFNAMIEIVIPYGQLTVADDGIGKVEEAHKAVKRLNSSIEKKRKELKAGALEYGRTVDSIAKQLSEKVDAVEVKLKAERDAFDAIEKAEKLAKEAAKAAKKQGRINEMVAAGIALDWTAVELSDEEWMWWFSKAKSQAAVIAEENLKAGAFAEQQRKEREKTASRIARMEALGVAVGSAERVAQLSDEQFEFDYSVAKKAIEDRRAAEEIERLRQAEELRIRAEEMERQRVADVARMAAERKAMEAEREEIRNQQKELRRIEAEKLEAERAEERKRREDAAKPELERLENIMGAILKHAESLMDPMPWWSGQFAYEYITFMDKMRLFVREGEDA